ncbi:MAG TPA: hypothetical protein VF937_08320, partial [Chloroflexota bacterium]
TYRTAAVLEIGGFQPTRAEDHLDTLVLAAHHYRGVFVPEPIAMGAGPETLDTYIQQQFAWAVSLVQVLFGYAPRLVRGLPFKHALQFVFAESWYPLSSTALLVMTLMPPVALITHQQPANVGLFEFLVRWLPISAVATSIWLWTRPWRMPAGLGLSWRTAVLYVARWPIVFWAFLNVLLRVSHSYMITRKGSSGRDRRTTVTDRRAMGGVGRQATVFDRRIGPQRRAVQPRRVRQRTGTGPVTTLRSRLLYLVVVWCMGAVVLWFITIDAWGLTGGSEVDHLRVQGFALLLIWGTGFFLAVYAVSVISGVVGLWQQSRRIARVVRDYGLAVPVLVVTVGFWLVLLNESVTRIDQTAGTRLWPGRALIPTSAPPFFAPLATPTPELASRPVAVATPTRPLELPLDRVTVGAYDPSGSLADFQLPLQHWFISQNEPDQIGDILATARVRQTIPLVTVEPFPAAGRQASSVLEGIVRGENDEQIAALARAVAGASPQVVLIRWAQEMDLSLLYPWSVPDGGLYQTAYRRVVSIFRQHAATNVRWVWSPSGNTPASAYYPGDDVVDYIGMTVLEDEQWARLLGSGSPRSFVELLGPKYPMLAPYGKPLIIAELGVSGTPDRQRAWLTGASQALPEFPQIRVVCYQDAVNVPNNLMQSQPDWRIQPAVFTEFLDGVTRATAPVE